MATIANPITTQRPKRAQIDEFLLQKRFAFVGVSRNPHDFTRKLFDEFCKRGYDVVPVNPGVSQVAGRRCFANIRDIQGITAALLMTPPDVTETVVADCIATGVEHVWMYRAGGAGAVNQAAVEACIERGINVIAGECPYMFFPVTGFPHRVHGFIKKIIGSYPS